MAAIDPKLNTAALNPAPASGSASTGATGKTAHLDPVKINTSSVSSNRSADREDEVQLSSLSSKINELQSGSQEREAYLDRLRLEVTAGEYQVSPAELASGIVADALLKSE